MATLEEYNASKMSQAYAAIHEQLESLLEGFDQTLNAHRQDLETTRIADQEQRLQIQSTLEALNANLGPLRATLLQVQHETKAFETLPATALTLSEFTAMLGSSHDLLSKATKQLEKRSGVTAPRSPSRPHVALLAAIALSPLLLVGALMIVRPMWLLPKSAQESYAVGALLLQHSQALSAADQAVLRDLLLRMSSPPGVKPVPPARPSK